MGFTETLIFYLLIGLGVSAAVWLASSKPLSFGSLFPLFSAVLFWPLYVPILLSSHGADGDLQSEKPDDRPQDAIALSIAQAESELDAALASLNGWAGEAFSRQHGRIAELKVAWTAQALRIRDLDRLLDASHTEFCNLPAEVQRVRDSEQARQHNLEQLREIRRQAHDDLTATLAWVRELVTMIHLAKFTGAPASRAEELVAQIAASVEGLSEVTSWRDREPPSSPALTVLNKTA